MSLLDALLRGPTDAEKKTFPPPSSPSPPSSPPDLLKGDGGGEGGDIREKVFISAKTPSAQDRARQDHMRAVLGAIVDPPGLASWLNGEHPDLLARGRALVKQIDAAWVGPLDKFERALNNLAVYHAECCREYQLHLQKSAEGVLERRSPRVEVREDMNPLTAKRLCWERQQKKMHGCNKVDGRCTVQAEKERQKSR